MSFAATWMQLEIITLNEVIKRKTNTKLYHLYSMWNLNYNTNKPTYETETESQTERVDWWLPRGERCWRGTEWEFGINRCKLVYIEQIDNYVLLYTTGNCVQYPVIKHAKSLQLCPTVQLHGLHPTRLLCLGKNIRVGCQALFQGIFPTQGSNPHLLHLTCIGCWVLYH